MVDIDRVKERVLGGERIEDVLSEVDWKGFEQAVGQIFLENGYHVTRNVRIKTDRRYEIDIVAAGSRTVFCVDCKQWSNGRDKRWAVCKAGDMQSNRTTQLIRFIALNPIASSLLKISSKCEFHSMIVSINDEAIECSEGKTIVVPLWKLNLFLSQNF